MSINGDVFKQLIDLRGPDECWLWLGSISVKTGYGKKQWFGRSEGAHRWVWTIFRGPVPEGMVINHLCRNRACVNPYHMEVTSQAENVRHGRTARLTPMQVAEIKAAKSNRRWGDGARLGRQFGVSVALIHDIWNDRAWRTTDGDNK